MLFEAGALDDSLECFKQALEVVKDFDYPEKNNDYIYFTAMVGKV